MLPKLLSQYPELTPCQLQLEQSVQALISCYEQGGKLLICGNGGSAADGDHITGELMKGFLKKRPLSFSQQQAMMALAPELTPELLQGLQCGLPAISLPGSTALVSAFCNDADPALVYAQGVMALGKPGDILIGMSTSGNAKNVCYAAMVAKGLGMKVLALTGQSGGKLATLADIAVQVPKTETYQIQELHLPVYHYLCAAVEEHFFPV